jgi:predicted nucleic acid-binding protein
VEDAQIAAIALANAMHLATRNASDFECLADLTLIDPWRVT